MLLIGWSTFSAIQTHYSDLGSDASWHVISMEFLHLFLRLHLVSKPLVAPWNVDCLLRLCEGCHKSLSCKSGFKLSTRDQLFEGRSKALNLGFFFMCSTAFSLIFFCAILRASNHQLVHKKNKTEMLFKLSNLISNHTLALGYLNPALNNLAHGQGYLRLPQGGSHEWPTN